MPTPIADTGEPRDAATMPSVNGNEDTTYGDVAFERRPPAVYHSSQLMAALWLLHNVHVVYCLGAYTTNSTINYEAQTRTTP